MAAAIKAKWKGHKRCLKIGFVMPVPTPLESSSMSQGSYYGLLSLIMCSWGNGLGVHMVVSNSVNHDSHDYKRE